MMVGISDEEWDKLSDDEKVKHIISLDQGGCMPTKKDNCPHCGKNNCVTECAYNNADAYGSKTFNLQCVHCGKPIVAVIHRYVKLERVEKGDHTEHECHF